MTRTIRTPSPPEGFRYAADILSVDEQQELVSHFSELPFKEFEFQGYLGKRRVVSFGWRYDFADYSLREAEAVPDFLLPLRDKAAAFAGLRSEELVHILVTEYRSGTTIGWHRDRDVFGDVVGVSLLSMCTFRFRRKLANAWERHAITLQPRSMYLLRGAAREEWEHSIPAVEQLRYSVTFRSLRPSDSYPTAGERVPGSQAESDPQLSFQF